MSVAAMEAALAATARYRDQQGPGAVEETFETLTARFTIASSDAALQGAGELVEHHGAEVELTFPVGAGVLTFRSLDAGTWRASGVDPVAAVQGLGHLEEGVEDWPAADLAAVAAELDALGGSGSVELPKASWRDGVEAGDARVWIGPSEDGFKRWLDRDQRTWRDAAAALFATPGTLVLLQDWSSPSLRAGPLVFARPGGEPLLPLDDHELAEALTRRCEETLLPIWRAARLKPREPLDPDLRRLLDGLAVSASAWVVAADPAGEELRPLATHPRRWTVPERLGPTDGGGPLRELADWCADGLSTTRLDVARRIAAEHIADPFGDAPQPHVIREAATVAYEVAVGEDVRDALERQEKFEQTFLDLDGRVAQIRSEIETKVDQVVTRALGTGAAFTLAAVVSDKFRGLPALIVAGVIVVYVLLNVWLLQKLTKPEAEERLNDAETLILGRRTQVGKDLSDQLRTQLGVWRERVRARLRTGTAVLCVLAVAAVAAGIGGLLAA